ncbi:caspase family protein [Actinoplanes sp. NPDC026623]|uniref:caspase family protein n=1 Tax=Actinoplanes sp. NPDC026623 TaxID=3155610 RepID=UPI0033EF8B04
MNLPDPEKSAAVIIGVATYAKSSPYLNLPAVENNVSDLARVLTDPETGYLQPDRCSKLLNRTSPMAVLKEIKRQAVRATDTFIIYFSGHGELDREGNLYLILRNARDQDELPFTALNYDFIRQVMHPCRAPRRIVILDCCHSGKAIKQFMSSSEEIISSQAQITGTYTLTATGSNKKAIAREGEQYTAFTSELISILEDGLPDKGEFVTLKEMYPVLRDRLVAAQLPKPEQCMTEEVGGLALTRNRAHRGYRPPSEGMRGATLADNGTDANHGSWFADIDKGHDLAVVSSVPPLPSPYASGTGGAASIALWAIVAILTAWGQWFSVPYTLLPLVGLFALALEAGALPGSRPKTFGIVLIVLQVISNAILATLCVANDRWGLAFGNILAFSLFVHGAISRGVHRSENARLAGLHAQEENKPEHQRISEHIANSPLTARLKSERWLGSPSELPIFDAISHIPGARFVQMKEEPESSQAIEEKSIHLREPDYVVICGTRVLAIYCIFWPSGTYIREATLTKDLRRNRKPYEAGRVELAEIVESLNALRNKTKGIACGLAIASVMPDPELGEAARRSQDAAAPPIQVIDRNQHGRELIVTDNRSAVEAVGDFLREDPYSLNLDVVRSLLAYASAQARADAGLSRYGSRRLVA